MNDDANWCQKRNALLERGGGFRLEQPQPADPTTGQNTLD